jgi:tetratricopeptide (TPR) repeat protein
VNVLDSALDPADSSASTLSADAVAFSWRERLSEGSFEAALKAYFAAGPEDPAVQEALESLCSLTILARSRAWNRARSRLQAITQRGDWLDWDQLDADLTALQAAAAALDSRDSEAALEQLESVQLNFFAAETANLRGAAAIFMGDFTLAREWFERAIELDPQHYRAVTNMGNAALEAGATDEAIEWYEKALRLNNDFPNAHHNLGVAWRKKGQIAKSIRSLKSGQKAQQRFDQLEAREQLGTLGRGAGRKYSRWLLYAAAAVAVYWFLNSRGML